MMKLMGKAPYPFRRVQPGERLESGEAIAVNSDGYPKSFSGK